MIKQFKYKTRENALVKVKEMKRLYGYTPSILRVKNPKTKKSWYVVVKPSGLKRI